MMLDKDWLFSYLKSYVVTLSLIVVNVVVFFSYFRGDVSSLMLMDLGGNFAPYTLDRDYYRLFYSMFLHGNLVHIILNAYSLYILGVTAESELGSFKTLEIYLISGLLAALSSLYFNLFVVSVGASGAIFGLYGYTLVREFTQSRNQSRFVLLANFIFYMAIMFFVGNKWGFDNAGHLGGLAGGILLALLDKAPRYRKYFSKTSLMWFVLVMIFFILPRFQVSYFYAFQHFVETDKRIARETGNTQSDAQMLDKIAEMSPELDSMLFRFRVIPALPRKLLNDVAKIESYVTLKKELFRFYQLGIERESYIFTDSTRHTTHLMTLLPAFNYPIYMGKAEDSPRPREGAGEYLQTKREAYDEDWFPTNDYDAVYYRLGYQDSLNEWHGTVEDYYRNGAIQMRGTYEHGLKDGIFLFYNKDSTYSSAGRYEEDDLVGKWEIFYSDNRLNYEMRYTGNRSYMLNFYDTLGNPLISEGEGEERYYHPNGQLSYIAKVEKGRHNGMVKGYDEAGKLIFQDYLEDGYFVGGVAYSPEGMVYKYDETAHQPFPTGGFEAFHEYLDENAIPVSDTIRGRVRMRFTVHKNGYLSNIRYMERLGEPYDSDAKNLLLKGPTWVAAKQHGYENYIRDTEIVVEYGK